MIDDIYELIGSMLMPADFYRFRQTCKSAAHIPHSVRWEKVDTQTALGEMCASGAHGAVKWLVTTRDDVAITAEIYKISSQHRDVYLLQLFYSWLPADITHSYLFQWGCVDAIAGLVHDGVWAPHMLDALFLTSDEIDVSTIVAIASTAGIPLQDLSRYIFQPDRILQFARYTPPAHSTMYSLIYGGHWWYVARMYELHPQTLHRYIFGDWSSPFDIAWVTKFIPYIDVASYDRLIREIHRFHDWAWERLGDKALTPTMIADMHNYGLAPDRPLRYYLPAAQASPCRELVELLILRGMRVDPEDIAGAQYIAVADALYKAYCIQMSDTYIILLCVIIIVAIWMTARFRPRICDCSKIDSLQTRYKR